MISNIKKAWEEHPYSFILLLAFIVRLTAAIFSKGFGMLDDHFVIIETAQDWVNGSNQWFREGQIVYRNLIYPGLHYIWFYFSDNILGLSDPQFKMLIARIAHALFSLLIISYSYKITLRLSNRNNARQVALILALFWPLPFLSVRNLVEVVCVPPVLAGFYYLLKNDNNQDRFKTNMIIAGILFGLSMTIRFQMSLFAGGVGLIWIFQKEWKRIVWFSLGFLFTISITIGLLDYLAWGRPFHTLINYVLYNISHQYAFVTQPWYNYILLIGGIFIPPVSLFFIVGYLRTWKKYSILFWPTFIFIFVHSYFANKQERFIIPAIPFIVILGIIGWNEYVLSSDFWNKHKKALKISWGWFWTLNIILMLAFTFNYYKKNRVESLSYLSNKENIKAIVWESNNDNIVYPPKFYLNKKIPIYILTTKKSLKDLNNEIVQSGNTFPDYIVFLGEKNIKKRVRNFELFFKKKLIFEKKINPIN